MNCGGICVILESGRMPPDQARYFLHNRMRFAKLYHQGLMGILEFKPEIHPVQIPPIQSVEFMSINLVEAKNVSGGVICEKAVSLYVNGDLWLTFMCTPLDLEELAIGFLYNERIINQLEEILSVNIHPDEHMIDVWLGMSVTKPNHWRVTSGCAGGMVSNDDEGFLIPKKKHTLSVEDIISIGNQLLAHQGLYQKVRGVHASGMFHQRELMFVSEDIGRHNTLDKLAGKMLKSGLDGKDSVIATSGRVSSEMLQKSARIGVGIVISRTSPTSLSILLAEQYQITLIGYMRSAQFNIYSHPDRVKLR